MFAKFAIFVSLFISAQAGRNLENYSFEQFVQEFKLKFSESELASRKSMFAAELARVQAHNAKNASWKEDVNQFSAMSASEKKAMFGRSKNANREAKKQVLKSRKELSQDFKMQPVSALPKAVDWRTKPIFSAVKDQGRCGSCWAFASTSVIESHVAINSGLLFDLSVQQMAMCAPNPDSCGGTGGCAGATAELAFDYVTKSSGLYQEFQYSYSSYYGSNYACAIPSGSPVATIDGYVQLPMNNYTALMNAIATVGPISISVDASAWSAYSSGVFNGCNQKQPDIDHAVVLVGYGEEANGQKYWTIRNSWSPTWGEKGFIRIARADTDESNCGTDITPQDGVACSGDNTPETVCGTCGVLFDSAYPLNAKAL